jgi:hypothetical protein
MPPVVFEPAISAGEWPQTDASDRAAAGTGNTYSSNTECLLCAKYCLEVSNHKIFYRVELMIYYFFPEAQQPISGPGRHIVTVRRSHTQVHHVPVGPLWTRDYEVRFDVCFLGVTIHRVVFSTAR